MKESSDNFVLFITYFNVIGDPSTRNIVIIYIYIYMNVNFILIKLFGETKLNLKFILIISNLIKNLAWRDLLDLSYHLFSSSLYFHTRFKIKIT